jgi:hypothetical protein
MRKIETVSKTVSLLATAFLNLAAESKQALPKKQIHPNAILCDLAGPVSEEKLRSLELRFHNLQSLYDTYVSTTETEVYDKDLPVLRAISASCCTCFAHRVTLRITMSGMQVRRLIK